MPRVCSEKTIYLLERQHSPGPVAFPANDEGAEKKRGKGGAQGAVLIVFHYQQGWLTAKCPTKVSL